MVGKSGIIIKKNFNIATKFSSHFFFKIFFNYFNNLAIVGLGGQQLSSGCWPPMARSGLGHWLDLAVPPLWAAISFF